VLISGPYDLGVGTEVAEKQNIGDDRAEYASRPALPGILKIDIPIVWATQNPRRIVEQSERLRDLRCSAARCPQAAVLTGRLDPAAALSDDPPDRNLAEAMLGFVRSIRTVDYTPDIP
jgi:hypothetical protein